MKHFRIGDPLAAGALALLISACSPPPAAPVPEQLPPTPTAQKAQALGWLDALAGYCWHEDTFGSDSCFWRGGDQQLLQISRNHGELLGCASLEARAGNPREIINRVWDAEHEEPPRTLYVTPQEIWSFEDVDARSDGSRRVSSWRQRTAVQFTLREEWRSPRGETVPEPAAPEGTEVPELVFERSEVYAGNETMAEKCRWWQSLVKHRPDRFL